MATLKSQKGQMALFIALIFQVLFVFFAMIINVGLIVHDKINLQNSADLAAYYAAQRQGEMLNAIAHYNYQIRQAWKLLVFRYRVLGDLGYKEHPLQKPGESFPELAAYADNSQHAPNVCINHAFWGFNQNLCFTTQIDIPAIPATRVINPFLPTNFIASSLIQNYIGQSQDDCKRTGPLNFSMLVKWLLAYRAQVSQAKLAVRKYADILSQDSANFLDIRGDSVSSGTVKTLRDNLTRSNLEGRVDDSFRLFNSLGVSGDRKKWLNEVLLLPRLFYTNTFNQNGCKGLATFVDGDGQASGGLPQGMTTDPTIEFARKESNGDDYLYHSSFGFEKNPWMMAYVGVYIETEPRKPFLPFGKPIKLTARAFAKPFGGRIGPWFFKQWPKGSNKSAGNFSLQTDSNVPVSFDPNDQQVTEGSNVFPNYARFPGDQLGLRSQAALAVFKRGLKQYFTNSQSGAPTATKPLSPLFYEGSPVEGDGLAQVPQGSSAATDSLLLGYNGPWIRDFEAAAVSPDLFDATYYSVEPDSFNNYTQPGSQRIFQGQDLPLDLGSLAPQFPVGIKKQIEVAEQLKSQNSSMNFFMINNWNHLLTAWAPSGAYEYDFPTNIYGECNATAKLPVPGTCAIGGRVGYSVKLISKDYLESNQLVLGGKGQAGTILNPPPF